MSTHKPIVKESKGSSPGCDMVVGMALFMGLIGILAFVDSMQNKQNVSKEPVDKIDTCARIKDSMRVYKVR